MIRSHRSLAWSLVLALLCASFALAHRPPTAQAAGSVFTVTTTSDQFVDPNAVCSPTTNPNSLPGCTLREALNSVNVLANAGSTIEFQILPSDPGYVQYPNSAAWIITPTIALPPITNSGTTIDGSTQTNRVGNTNNDGAEIIINGQNVTNAGGLVIPQTSSNVTIRGIGIVNFKGDNTPGSLKGVGIEIYGSNNKIEGNYIGLGIGPSGTVAIPNIDAGIIIYGQGNTIGGDATALTTKFNVISGNAGDGIQINGGNNNIIAGNYIGTNGAITGAIPNGGNGINIRNGANGNTIGNYLAAAVVSYRNFIGGNNGYGILIKDSSTNKIYGNFVGLNRFGNGKISNALGGIRIDGTSTNSASGNIIGAVAPSPVYMRNYIVGNAGAGIQLNSFGARQNQVVANYVGLGSDDKVPSPGPQLSTGILLDAGASDNTIGGSISSGSQNIVAGIAGDGIKVAGFFQAQPLTILRAQNNVINGNYVGVGPNGSTSIPNSGAGIALDTYVVNTSIGGATADLRNLISNNALDGIAIRGTNVTTTTIRKNTITFNTGSGINITNATNTQINGGDAAGAIPITNNGANGVKVTNSVTTTVQFASIKSNAQNGVQISGSQSKFNAVTSSTLNANTQNGVLVDTGAQNTTISSSTIYTNTLNGVSVQGAGSSPQRVKIVDNSMQGNLKGIELNPETSGQPGVSTNPNHDIDPPFSMHIDQAGKLTGKIRLTPTNPATAACVQPCTIQVFSTNPQTLDGQGRDKINVTATIVPDSPDPSTGTFTAAIGSIPAQLALTATDKDGNTSEFATFTRSFGLDIAPPRASIALPSQVITYTHRITNTGTVDFANIQLTAVSKLGWPLKLAPTSPIALAAGQSKPVTLTLTLPSGSDARVLAGLVELTRVTASATTTNPSVVTTASVTDTTTVGASFLLDATPLTRSGVGAPDSANSIVRYVHTLTNKGNVSGTVLISAVTDRGWDTTVSTSTVTLAPGEVRNVTISVSIPSGTAADTVAKTIVTLNVPGTPSQSKTLTDTTSVELTASALLSHVGDVDGEGAAGGLATFLYVVENRSNGPATFSLSGLAALNSVVSFARLDGQAFGPNNSFTLSNVPGSNQLNFAVTVRLGTRLAKGNVETVTVLLLDSQGRTRAAAQDKITIVQGLFFHYMPLVVRN
jgi:hypothetical protein